MTATGQVAAGGRAVHLVSPSGESLCGLAHPRPGRRWLGTGADRYQEKAAAKPPCRYCVRKAGVLRQIAESTDLPGKPGVIAVVEFGGRRWTVAGCADCEQVRPIHFRGLCVSCATRRQGDGTIAGFGYVRAERFADYTALRRGGVTIAEAAARVGVSVRTAHRYERDLRETGAAA